MCLGVAATLLLWDISHNSATSSISEASLLQGFTPTVSLSGILAASPALLQASWPQWLLKPKNSSPLTVGFTFPKLAPHTQHWQVLLPTYNAPWSPCTTLSVPDVCAASRSRRVLRPSHFTRWKCSWPESYLEGNLALVSGQSHMPLLHGTNLPNNYSCSLSLCLDWNLKLSASLFLSKLYILCCFIHTCSFYCKPV